MKNKTIFWDFDGVIADTFEQCFSIVRMGYPEMTADEYRQLFEGNINKATYYAEPVMEVDFSAEFEKTIFDASLTTGIADVIKELDKQYRHIIISSTITPLIGRYLIKNGLHTYFTEIMGNDVAHSKVEKFKLAFQKYETSKSEAVLITDTLGDIVEANKVGLPTIAVGWGFQAVSTLEKGNPIAIINNAADLIPQVHKVLGS